MIFVNGPANTLPKITSVVPRLISAQASAANSHVVELPNAVDGCGPERDKSSYPTPVTMGSYLTVPRLRLPDSG